MALVDLNDAIISQVRQAADIVDVISQVTPLKIAGKSHKGLCPFHREKTPSFTVDRGKGFFYCFGCGQGGDVFKFLMLTERFTFPEAVEHVAARVGIELPRKRKNARETDKDDLRGVIEDASEAFHQALQWTPNAAEEYLRKRKVQPEVISKYGFGFAPDSWDYILRLLGQKHGEKKLELAGLVTPRKEKAGFYDRFRNRLMIPIHSETGALVGFGGRSLDGSEPKYLNSPESEVFNKSRLLYNLHRSKDAMRRNERAILVEGYFDAIAIDHAGVPGVVASMGTSLTAGQASLLRRYARRVVIAYDGDEAGKNATIRAAQVLLAAGLEVLAVDMGTEKDPDAVVENRGVDGLLEVLGSAADIFTFALRIWGQDGGSLVGREKAERVEKFVPLLRAVADPVLRNDAAQRISDAFRLEFSSVWSQVRGTAPRQEAVTVHERVWNSQESVLAAAIQGRLAPEHVAAMEGSYFEDPRCSRIFSLIEADARLGEAIDVGRVTSALRGEEEIRLFSELLLGEYFTPHFFEKLADTLQSLRRGGLERRARQLQVEISAALQAGDEAKAASLDLEKMKVARELSSLTFPTAFGSRT